MSAGMVNEQNYTKHIEKQMGCMASFLQIFDRQQILSGKRHYSAKRLPPSPVVDTTSESEKSAPQSPAISKEFVKINPEKSKQTPAAELRSPAAAELPPKSPLPLPIFENRSSWKFSKEAPRLSLDSRATTDAKGGLHPKEIRTAAASMLSAATTSANSNASYVTDESQQHRSPSVIARLMGLEPLPDSAINEPEKKPELRRSASESRVSRDLFHSRFIAEASSFSSNKQTQPQSNRFNNNSSQSDSHFSDPRNYLQKNANKAEIKGLNRGSFNASSPWKQQRRSFFDSGDFFPEPRQTASIYGEIENRLKMRGIDETSKDLETLKQILEALQLKGLLHSRKHSLEQNHFNHRNLVYDDSPIVVMRPSTSTTPVSRKMSNHYSPSTGVNQSRGARRNYRENSPSMSPRRDRNVQSPVRTGRSPSPTTTNRSEGNAVHRRSNSLVKPKPLSVETQRKMNDATENRRVSPVHSPKLNPRRTGLDQTASNRSPRSKKSTAEIHQREKKIITSVVEDESSSISGSSITTSTDTERSKTEEYKEGRSLLERCGKLLHSIAEMNATDMQPSPVSVLDSSFSKDGSSTPSPVMTRRNLDFKDHSGELDDDIWSPAISPVGLKCKELSDDSDFVYISEILSASHYLPEDSDVFLLLEKQQYLQRKDICKVSSLQRKLIFDTIQEILDRNRRLPPWKVVSWTNYDATKPSLDKVWSEFQRIRERDTAEDLFETICGVLKKDLAGDEITGWGGCPIEMSEAIRDIERLIFKDLISETIRDLAALASRNTSSSSSSSMMPRRKLAF